MDINGIDNLMSIISTIVILGGIWLIVRTIFKITMKVFMFGCIGIVLFAIFSIVSGMVG